MEVQQFLAHHGIKENPFDQEDAQSDHVFQQYCLDGTKHPAWDKIFGNPSRPSTSVIFGEKGSGKTALRLQIIEQLHKYNSQHADQRAFIVEYDDFNPFLDSFRERLHGRKRKEDRALSQWRLWDHIDAILTLSVTRLTSAIVDPGRNEENNQPLVREESLDSLGRLQQRDLLLLSAFYDHTFDQSPRQRWSGLRKKLRFSTWKAEWDRGLGIVGTIAVVTLLFVFLDRFTSLWWLWLALTLAAWTPWLIRQMKLLYRAWQIRRQIRVFDHLPNSLRHVLARFGRQELAGQPMPNRDRSDDRYELLLKLQSVLKHLGFTSMVVLVDRVDEPHLVNGSPERMRDLLWPMFDNKFLKHPGLGFKMLLPAEVVYYLNRQEKEFYERSRLDKQNLILSLQWTGESLYDVANHRIAACVEPGSTPPTVGSLFEEALSKEELIGIFSRLRVPRHLFKFLYRLLVEHSNRYTAENPSWKISRETVQATLAVYVRDLEAFDRGMGTG